jgi:hypothetical protein
VHVAALLCRVAKLVRSRQLRPRDILALPSMLPQVRARVRVRVRVRVCHLRARMGVCVCVCAL